MALAVLAAAAVVPVSTIASSTPAAAQASNGGCQNPTTPTDASGQPLVQPYDPATDNLLIPTWGDGGGWTQPSQYSTIMGGDVDGDGWGDLLGRNGLTVETYTPAPPERSAAAAPYNGSNSDTHPPFPGQWVYKSVVTPPAAQPPSYSGPPTFREKATNAVFAAHTWNPAAVPGFSDPSRYSTMRLADIDGDGAQELIARVPVLSGPQYGVDPPYDNSAFPQLPIFQGTKILVYKYTTSTDAYGAKHGDWVLRTPSGSPLPEWDDSTHAANGNQHFGNQSGANASGHGGPFSLPQYYSSIMTGDIDGDGKDELIGRGPNGIETYTWDDANNQFTGPIDPSGLWADTNQGNSAFTSKINDGPQYWASFRIGNFDGRKTADGKPIMSIVFRGPDGLYLSRYDTTNKVWSTGSVNAAFSDTNFGPGGAFDAWATLRVGNIDGQPGDEIMGVNKQGQFVAFGFEDTQTVQAAMTRIVVAPQTLGGLSLTDNTYVATLQTGDVTGSSADELLFRTTTGMAVYQWEASSGAMQVVQISGFLPFSDNVYNSQGVAQATGWQDPSRYLTIKTVPWHKGEKRLLIGRDATGVRTYQLKQTTPNSSQWTTLSAAFPQYAGGSDPNGWDDTTDLGKAYRYINDQVATVMNWGTPTYPGQSPSPAPLPTIRSKFATGSGVSNWADIATLVEIQEPPTDAISPTLSRDDYEAVKRNTADWTRDVALIWGYFFQNSSGQSLEQLTLNALVMGDQAYPIDQIAQQFDPPDKSRMFALIGDLLWGAFTAFNPELFFADAVVDGETVSRRGARSVFQATTSMSGAMIGAGLGYADKSGKKLGELDVEAAYLDELLAAQFCNGIAFLYGSADEAGNDLGLLTAMAQNLRSLPPANQTYAQMIAQLSTQRSVWAYQQFASMIATGSGGVGWQMGYDQVTQDVIQNTWPTPVGGTYPPSGAGHGVYVPYAWQVYVGGPTNNSKNSNYWAYQFNPVGKNCDTGSNGLGRPQQAMTTLTEQLGVDPNDLAGPTLAFWDGQRGTFDFTTLSWSGSPDQIYQGQPQLGRMDPDGDNGGTKKLGTMGWRLPAVSKCAPINRVGYF